MTRAALMAAFTAVAAQISIPLEPIPFTFQVLAVVLTGLLLGPRYGALAMAIYLLLGAVGVPVFSGFTGGLGQILGPTGGYLLSYPIAAAVAGMASGTVANAPRGRGIIAGVLWGWAALATIYAGGVAWLVLVGGFSLGSSISQGVLLFLPLDLAKVGIAVLVAVTVAPVIAARRRTDRDVKGRP